MSCNIIVEEEKMITVFTPTYNRAYILGKLYESLKNQTSENFEWIIVDDASTDNTEELVASFEEVGKGISYIKQAHGGKHRAINRAVKLAKGDYFFIVDSDDHLTYDAIELVTAWTAAVDRDDIAGVSGLRVSTSGKIWGGELNFDSDDYIEAGNLEREAFNLMGDKAEVYSTKVLQAHPFPEFDNEYFVTEAVVWNWIALDGYKLRWYNKPIYVCEYLEDGLTKNGANDQQGHIDNPHGYGRYVATTLKALGINQSWYDFWNYCRIADRKNIAVKNRLGDLQIGLGRYWTYMAYSLARLIFAKIHGCIKRK